MFHCLAIFRGYTSSVLVLKETENMDRLSGELTRAKALGSDLCEALSCLRSLHLLGLN